MTRRDSEDVVLADFDGDVFFASEDDQTDELFLNDGAAHFEDASDRLPRAGTSNAAVFDPEAPEPTVLVGNAGQNFAFAWRGDRFVDVTADRLPLRSDITQDLELGDVDGDGDLDLAVGNEDPSVLLLRDGDGFHQVIELDADAETREIDISDADGDGDLDLALANIRFVRREVSRLNRLLIQVAPGVFEDATTGRLPEDDDDSFDIEPVDIDGDGDLDLVTANLAALSGNPADAPTRSTSASTTAPLHSTPSGYRARRLGTASTWSRSTSTETATSTSISPAGAAPTAFFCRRSPPDRRPARSTTGNTCPFPVQPVRSRAPGG